MKAGGLQNLVESSPDWYLETSSVGGDRDGRRYNIAMGNTVLVTSESRKYLRESMSQRKGISYDRMLQARQLS